jgi:hypothetical protein
LPSNGEIATVTVATHPLVLGLQPAALVDNVAHVDWSLLDQIPGDRGGSMPVLSFFSISLRFYLILASYFFLGYVLILACFAFLMYNLLLF